LFQQPRENLKKKKHIACESCMVYDERAKLESDKHQIKAVTFDLWETLLFERTGDSARRTTARCRGLTEAFRRLGVELTVAQSESALRQTVDSLLKVWDSNRDVSHLEQLKLVVKFALNSSVNMRKEWINELSAAYVAPLFEIPPLLNPEAHKVLRWLRNREKKVGLICNTGLTPGTGLRRFLEKEGVAGYFDVMIFSDEVGIRKPSAKIFYLAARKLKTEPFEIVHVGDNLKVDVCGAKNASFKAVHFLCEEARDKDAASDPSSLAYRSRNLGKVGIGSAVPDETISSLAMLVEIVEKMDANSLSG
jgi:FMN phosphatase YigB (HAD superfamily)